MGETMLVTGCSSGLGLDLAVMAAAKGYRVTATMRDLAKRDALDTAARDAGVEIAVEPLDVTDPDSVDRTIAATVAREGGLDILVNNAGQGSVRTTEWASEVDAAHILDVNFHGVVRTTRAALPNLRKNGGRVVNISSVGGLVGQPFNELYCAAKFAVEGYTESLATYVGPAFGIHFTAIEPGGIASDFAQTVLADFQASGKMDDPVYGPLLQRYLGAAQARRGDGDSAGVYQTSKEVAAVVLDCLAMDAPPIRLRTSDWAENLCRFKTRLDPDGKAQQAHVIDYFMGGREGWTRD